MPHSNSVFEQEARGVCRLIIFNEFKSERLVVCDYFFIVRPSIYSKIFQVLLPGKMPGPIQHFFKLPLALEMWVDNNPVQIDGIVRVPGTPDKRVVALNAENA